MDFIINSNDSHSNISNISSKKCSKCHSEIYKQWEKSMHAKSTELKDPIHGIFYSAVAGIPATEGVRIEKNKNKCPVCL